MKQASQIIKKNLFPIFLGLILLSSILLPAISFLIKGTKIALGELFVPAIIGLVLYFFWKQIWANKIARIIIISVAVFLLLSRTEKGQELLGKLITWGIFLGIILLFFGKQLKKWFN